MATTRTFTGNFTSGTQSYTPSGFAAWDDAEASPYYREATDSVGLDDSARLPIEDSAADAFSGDDSTLVAYGKSEADVISCDDAIPSNLYLGQLVAQTLGISPELAPKVIQIVALASTGGLSDDPIVGFGLGATDTAGMDDAFVVGIGQVLAAALGVAPSLDSQLKTSRSASDETGLDESAGFSFDLLASDALGAAEDLALLLVFNEMLLDAAGSDDAPAAAVGFISVASDTLGMDEVPSTLIAAIESVSDTAALGGVLRLPDAEYVAWVVNSENLALSRYSGYAFNSFAAFQTTYLGATDVGIYELEGDDDVGVDIDARIRTGLMEFGSSRQKAMPSAYLGYTADGSLGLKVITTDGGTKTETWYKLTETKGAPDTARIRVGKGLKARYWGFELANVGGSDFEVDHLHLYPVVLTRRI